MGGTKHNTLTAQRNGRRGSTSFWNIYGGSAKIHQASHQARGMAANEHAHAHLSVIDKELAAMPASLKGTRWLL